MAPPSHNCDMPQEGVSPLDIPTWPQYSQQEADLIHNLLLSNRVNYWTGEEGRCFETEFAQAVGCHYGVALANGSLALEAALLALQLPPDAQVVVPARSFVATAMAVLRVGATPVFADVDAHSQNLTAATTAAALTPQTRAIICVHLAGWPGDMEGLSALAREHGLYLLEDCAQAHGACYKDRPVGSFGHVAAWSFCQDKIITTGGEGGMVTTNDEELWQRLWALKDHGKSYAAVYQRQHAPGYRWLHESVGSNLRLTEMQAALGRWQLQRLTQWQARRQQHAAHWAQGLAQLPGLRLPWPPEHLQHAWYVVYLFVEPQQMPEGCSRDQLLTQLQQAGVPARTGVCPELYREKVFQDAGLAPAEPLPVARQLGQTSLVLPCHPALTRDHIDAMLDVVFDTLPSPCFRRGKL